MTARARSCTSPAANVSINPFATAAVSEKLRSPCHQRVTGWTVTDNEHRPRRFEQCRRGEQVVDPFFKRQTPHVEEVLGSLRRRGCERRIDPEPKRDGRLPPGVLLRIDDRHHRIDRSIRMVIDASQNRRV